jgi:hypothetical protein
VAHRPCGGGAATAEVALSQGSVKASLGLLKPQITPAEAVTATHELKGEEVRARRTLLITAATMGVSGSVLLAPTSVSAGKEYTAGLVTICTTDAFIRVGGVNNSPLPVVITAQENKNGKPVDLLNPNASDELRAIFPVTIPANSSSAVTWELPLPAHLNGAVRGGNDRNLHGSWLPKQWEDENGLSYKGVSGSAAGNGKNTCPTPPPPPPAKPVLVRPAALYSTSNSQLASSAGDGNPDTAFVTQMAAGSHPTWAWLNADLGENVPLQRIEWMWSAPGAADDVKIQTTLDGITWTTVATPGAAPVGTWNSHTLDRQVRIVRFRFSNPNKDAQLGYLSEVRFFAEPGFVPTTTPQVLNSASITSRAEAETKPATGTALISGRYKVKRSMRSSNSPASSSHLTIDGKSSTAWQTAMTMAPRSGWVAYDLGGTAAVGEIRYKFATLGMADKWVIQASPDGINWTTISVRSNATTANSWVSVPTSVSTRYVRLLFTNPNNEPTLGGLSEVRFYPAS